MFARAASFFAAARAKVAHFRASEAVHHGIHATGENLHMVYFAAVFFEGHGLYALAGGALLAVAVLAKLAGVGND